MEQDDEEDEDEGFEDETSFFSPSQDKDLATVSVPSDNEEDQEQEEVYTDLHNTYVSSHLFEFLATGGK